MRPPHIFEWDRDKADANIAKHGLPFEEAVAVFAVAGRADFDASHPDDGEARRKVVAPLDGRLITVVYTVRDEACRIISARRSNAMEARRYADR